MARIIPARPRSSNAAEETALLALERDLDDDYLVVQGFPKAGHLLIAHPDEGFCALACAEGVQRFDADAEAWTGADPDEAVRDARRSLGNETSPGAVAGLAFLAETPVSAAKGTPANGVLFLETSPQLAALVGASMPGQAPGEASMGALIRRVSPGAANYARGWVTDAQATWRANRTGSTPPVATAVASAGSSSHPASLANTTEEAAAAAKPEAPTLEDPTPETVAPGSGRKLKELSSDATTVLLLRQVTEQICQNRRITISGMEIQAEEVVDPAFMLPALLVAAAQEWAPVVLRGQGKGGFHLRLRSDDRPICILGYRVAALELSAPLLLILPVVDLLRRAMRPGDEGAEELCLDGAVLTFRKWLEANRFNTDAVSEIDVRMAIG